MFYKVISGAVWGMEPYIVAVEADVANGMPYFNMVGMLSSEVKEAKERVRSALKNSGYKIPPQRITVNLSPADRKKKGAAFDLPIAIAVLRAMGMIKEKRLKNTLVIGELGLDGKVKPVKGVLPIVLAAKKAGISTCIVPINNYEEAIEVGGMKIIPAANLMQAVSYIMNGLEQNIIPQCSSKTDIQQAPDFNEIYGNAAAKRAAEIAAAGNHNMLMIGPPGAGKSMIASRISGILPDVSSEESLEVSSIYSICGLLQDGKCIKIRPFRAPHHTITLQGMTGGGKYPVPGELSLAHKGVLFLDEVTEFMPAVLDTLRQPLEDKRLIITRASGTYTFDTDCMVVAAMNPCKCGFYPDRTRCICTDEEVRRYMGRISGAILDRMDICVEVSRVNYNEIGKREFPESSEDIRKRVVEAVELQKERYKGMNISGNSMLTPKDIDKFCHLNNRCEDVMKMAFDKLNLSARGYFKILKVARTIADLDGSTDIEERHLSEAIIYKTMDKGYYK
ncbi:MAG: YifB family Mg chelatase-like AAA ATPase [Lachnospiraceae bacterium]|nr:YifB family Mg chelatase-like AAA ATPase [Lachnospiraceae bacterium]MDE6253727.1 YifB family Mg chelatase-like AAA ATPase [Lachnospiraceae bacterium]